MNIRNVCKAIKQAGKHRLIWTREKDRHFITSGAWLVKFDIIPNEVLASLFGVFFIIPEIGDTWVKHFEQDPKKDNSVNYSKIYEPMKQTLEFQRTLLLREINDRKTARVFKSDSMYVMLDKEYADLASSDSIIKGCENRHSPIYFEHESGTLIVMPYRFEKPEPFKELEEQLT